MRPLLVVAFALIAAAAAWTATSRATPLYERTISLVVVPDPRHGPSDVSSEVVTTLAEGIGSRRFLIESVRGVHGEPIAKYSLAAFVRPGSDIIDARFRGTSRSALTTIARNYLKVSSAWAHAHYAAYNLSFLETNAPPARVYPHPKRMAAVGFLLGGLLGVLVLVAEAWLRNGRLPTVSWQGPQVADVTSTQERTTRRESGPGSRRIARGG